MSFKAILLFLSMILFLAIDETFSSPLVDNPQKCYREQKFPCALVAADGNLMISKEGIEIRMRENSVLEFSSPSVIQILKGEAWLKSSRWLKLRMAPGLELQYKGDLLLSKSTDGSVNILNLDAEIDFEKSHLFVNESLPIGFENWYSLMRNNSGIARGIIRPIDKARFVKDWSRYSLLSLAESRKILSHYEEIWAPAIDEAAQFYQEIVQRRLASIEEAETQERLRRKRVTDERAALRKMYRQKLGLEPDSQD